MPTRHYGVVVPESQKVPCIISTYQRAYGSRTTDRPFSNGGRKFGAVVARKRNDGNGMNCLIVYEEIEREA